jgi:Domain of unknown function (DUF4136)
MVAAAAVVVGAKVKVQTQYDKKFNFAGLHTYAWHSTGKGDVKLLQASGENPAALRSQLEPMVVRSVEGALGKRGFTVASGAPDLEVYYYVLIGPGISAQTMGQFIAPVPEWGIPPFAPATSSIDMYEQGSLIVDLSSPSLGAMVWRGSAQAEIDRTRTPADREKRIRDAVDDMFKKFPPKK